MTSITHQVEQHILEHESRLGHIDELLERAGEVPGVAGLKEKRDELAGQLDAMKQKTAEEWQHEELAQAGPMGVWDAVAQELERLLEKTGL
jgi:hypothetical protein